MEHIACDTCGQDRPRSRPDLSASLNLPATMAVVECQNCGLRYMNPRMTASEYRDFYAGEKYLHDYGYDTLLSDSRQPEFGRTLKKIAAVQPPPGKLLDIGTATGEFLVAARKAGWKVYGTDVSDSSVQIAKQKHGLELFHGELHQAPWPEHSFDVIHLSHVLEHVPSPQQTLATIKRLLKPGGLLVVSVPNEFENWWLKLGKALGRYRPPTEPSIHHVYFFTTRSLAETLTKAGYQASVSTYSPQAPISHPPAWLRPGLAIIMAVVDRSGGGIHIQAVARPN